MVAGNSHKVESNQEGVHPDIEKVVKKHLCTDWKKPVGQPTLDVWKILKPLLIENSNFILDSGCGTGDSSLYLAKKFPEQLIVGVDKSEVRLNKVGKSGKPGRNEVYQDETPSNIKFVRADLNDLWRLMVEDNVLPQKHFLFYPNPWPKSIHLKRRFHGHSVFPYLVKLCPNIEVRSNWEAYVQEFSIAWSVAFGSEFSCKKFTPLPGEWVSAFEKKYDQSGHGFWKMES
jgi:tRNA (guanine-N7-)-methyltransferase